MSIHLGKGFFLIFLGNDDVQIQRGDFLCSQEFHLPEASNCIFCDSLNIERSNPNQLIVTLVHKNDPELVFSEIVLRPSEKPLPGQKDIIRRALPEKVVPPLTERAELLQGLDYAD